jgi:hypothetical protein
LDNINKPLFNKRLAEYLAIDNKEEANRYFNSNLYEDLKAIVFNVTYSFQFQDERFLYEDVESELILHFLLKYMDIKYKYSNINYYNLIYTLFSRKFIDLLRSYKVQNERREKMVQVVTAAVREFDCYRSYEILTEAA